MLEPEAVRRPHSVASAIVVGRDFFFYWFYLSFDKRVFIVVSVFAYGFVYVVELCEPHVGEHNLPVFVYVVEQPPPFSPDRLLV